MTTSTKSPKAATAAQEQPSYSQADLSRHFGVPESSIRFYCKRFAPWLPMRLHGKKKRYLPKSLEVFQYIMETMPLVRTASLVEERLATRFAKEAQVAVIAPKGRNKANPANSGQPTRLHPVPTQPETLAALPEMLAQVLSQQANALEGIAKSLNQLAGQQQHIDALQSRTKEAEAEAELLRKEVATLRLLLDASEKTQQSDLEQLRTWMGRVIRERRPS